MVQYGHYTYCIYILFGLTAKETLELGIMGSLWEKSTGHQWNLSQKANNPEWASMSSTIMTEQKVFISNHYSDVIMATMASQITSLTIVYSIGVGNSPVAGEFPAQRASNAENVSIWWRHHAKLISHKRFRESW